MSDKGGHVFPSTYEISPGKTHTLPGLSLRDLYAGMAMHAIIAASGRKGEVSYKPYGVACNAFVLADAMLAEREKSK